MNFGEILSRAWQIVWRFKVLWIFGILASCGSNSGSPGSGNAQAQWNEPGGQAPYWMEDLGRWAEANVGLIIAIVVIVSLLIVVVSVLLTTVGRVALVRGANDGDEGVTRMTFGSLWAASTPYFWRVIGLLLLVALIGFALFLVVMIPLIIGIISAIGTQGDVPYGLLGALPVFFCLLCLLIPISWIINLVVEQAVIAIVLEDLGVRAGLRRGWDIIRGNLGNILLMALILYGGRWLASIIVSIPLIAVALGMGMGGLFAYQGNGDALPGLIAGAVVLLLCVLGPIYLIINGFFQAYVSTAWTLTFRRLTGRQAGTSISSAPLATTEPA